MLPMTSSLYPAPTIYARSVSRLLKTNGFERAEGVRQIPCSYKVPATASGFHCWLGTSPQLDRNDPDYFGVVIDWYGNKPSPLSSMAFALEKAGYRVFPTTGNALDVCVRKPNGTWDIQHREALSVKR